MKNNAPKFPYVDPKVVQYLKEKFPLSDFLRANTEGELKFLHGVHEVITHLENIQERQDKAQISSGQLTSKRS